MKNRLRTEDLMKRSGGRVQPFSAARSTRHTRRKERRTHILGSTAARGILVFLLVCLNLGLWGSPIPVSASSHCATSNQPAYTVTVCVTNPAHGATLSGVQTISASASVIGSNPGVQRMIFYLGGEYLLTDYQSPYIFNLPTDRFVDGGRSLAVAALMRDGFTSQQASINITFDNGVTTPPVNNNSFTPSSGTTPSGGRPFVMAVAGDGAGGEINAGNVVNLMDSWNPNLVLYLGDVYEKGTPTEFYNWYGSGSNFFSRFKAITNPVIGNHEYEDGQAPGYFDYWDNIPNYYSFNAAGWHFISLNSTSQFRQTAPGSPQYQWLLQDLNANTATCTAAYFHHPVYSVGPQGDSPELNDIWALLAAHDVDLVLTGHEHSYQRWVPLNGSGTADPNGVTFFVVGSSGHGIQGFVRSDNRLAAGADTPPNAYGALRVELNEDGAAFQYVNTQGTTLDSGSVACSGSVPDTEPPSVPGSLIATSISSTHVNLTWTGSTDNVGVTSYEIYRNGSFLATIGAVTSYADSAVAGGATYQYQLRALDAAGNASGMSNIAVVTTPTLLFSDELESGDLSKWAGVTNLIVQSQEVFEGSYAARETSSGAATWAYRQLTSAQNELYYRLRFKIISQASNVYLLKFRTAAGTSILGLYVSNTGRLAIRNDAAGITTTSTTNVNSGVWHDVQIRALVNGASGEIQVWLDGVPIAALNKTETLGTTPIGRIQLGDNSTGRIYDVALDNIQVSSSLIDMTPPSVGLTEPDPDAVIRSDVTLAAAASDDVAVDRVEFFVNSALVGTDYTAPYSVVWDSTLLADGPVTVTARAVDTTLNSSVSTGRTVTVDNTPPDTTIDSGPSGTVSINSAVFTFSSNESGATFVCFLDDIATEDCGSPQSYTNLSDGTHTFQVSAIDLAGNTDPTPATRTWTVVAAPPTQTSTDTPTSVPSFTPTPTDTPTETPTPTPTDEPTLTYTATFTDTPTLTATPTATFTPTDEPTSTPTPTFTGVPTDTPTSTPTPTDEPTPTFTPTYTDTPSSTPTFTSTPTDEPTSTFTPTFTEVPTDTPTFTSTPTDEPTSTHTPTVTAPPTDTPSSTPTFTPTPTDIPTPTHTPTFTAAPTDTPTLSPTPTDEPTPTFTPTYTATPTPSPSDTPTLTSTPTPQIQSFIFPAVADSYVNQSKATTNYGTATTLRTDGSPIISSYIRFNVSGLSGSITRVTLRVYANNSSSTGYIVNSLADNTWSELAINYNNAPLFGSAIGSSGAFGSGTWTSVDVTSYITGGGTFNLVLTNASSTLTNLASRETGANAPQLVIETTTAAATATPTQASAPTDTPVHTPTAVPTNVPTFTSTPTPLAQSFVFTPVADAYVNQSKTTTNYGTATTLRTDASPILRSYLRFNVSGLSGIITRVTLRVYANNSSSSGYIVNSLANNTWGELTLNFNNAPPVGSVIGSSGGFSSGLYTTVDVTSYITGEGTFSLALTSSSSTLTSLASRETGVNAPQLIIETVP